MIIVPLKGYENQTRLKSVACIFVLSAIAYGGEGLKEVFTPQIVSPWWQVAVNPMDHKYAAQNQSPVDFAICRQRTGPGNSGPASASQS